MRWKKKKRKNINYYFIFLVFIFSGFLFIENIGLISSFILIDKNSSSIEKSYFSSEVLRGKLNISIKNEPASLAVEVFDNEMKLIDFLNKTSANFTFTPEKYESKGKKEKEKTFKLDAGEEKLVGFEIKGKDVEVTSFSFKISSSSGPSCFPQLFIDLFNDKEIDWMAHLSGKGLCRVFSTCFEREEAEKKAKIIDRPYCEKFTLPPRDVYTVGAEIYREKENPGEVKFTFTLFTPDHGSESCEATANPSLESQNISCEIKEISIQEQTDAYACISVSDEEDINKYSVLVENKSPCGFFGFPEDFDGTFKYDFPIFIEYKKYSALGNFYFDQKELENFSIDLKEEINEYIRDAYPEGCEEGCIIPLRFLSFSPQNLKISNVEIDYISGITEESDTLFFLEKIPSKIDMDYQLIDLKKAGLKVPKIEGEYPLKFYIGNTLLLKSNITVKKGLEILEIIPQRTAAEVPTTFFINLPLKNISLEDFKATATYYWDFGDGTTKQTSVPEVTHTYKNISTFNLTLKISSDLGSATKTQKIEVSSPREIAGPTLEEYKKELEKFSVAIEKYPKWISEYLKNYLNLTEKSKILKDLEGKLKKAFKDTDYIEIMKKLNSLEIITNITKVKVLSFPVFPSDSEFRGKVLEKAGAGKMNENRSEKDYTKAIRFWTLKNLNITFHGDVYSGTTVNKNKIPLFTHAKITFTPKKKISKLYFVVNGKNIKFKSHTPKQIGDSSIIALEDLKEKTEVEFLVPQELNIDNLPFYLSPPFDKLVFEEKATTPCNNNGKCEKGENKENCPNDCRSWKTTIILWIILFIIALGVYIALQEWYKKHYESYLFPNKNELFNLINFMYLSTTQGKNKKEIFESLLEKGWKKEQLTYAWNKFKGKRTGMWEIPIFKWKENKEVKKELEKRKSKTYKEPPKNPFFDGKLKFKRFQA